MRCIRIPVLVLLLALSVDVILGPEAFAVGAPSTPSQSDTVESALPTGSEWFDLIGTYRWRNDRTAEVYGMLRENGAEAFIVNGLSMYGSPDDGVILLEDGGWVVGFMLLSDYDFQGRRYTGPSNAKWPFNMNPGAPAKQFAGMIQMREDLEFVSLDERQYPGLQTGVYRHTRKGNSSYIAGFGLRQGTTLQMVMVLLPPRALAATIDKHLFPVPAEGGWGFIDQFGFLQVEGRFDSVDTRHSFSEGLIAVHDGKGWGYMNQKGEMAIAGHAEWTDVAPFSEGRARVGIADPTGEFKHVYGYIDREGNAITEFVYQGVLFGANFSEGRCRVQRDSRMGYIDRTGNEVIAPQYFNGHPFSEGTAAVRDETSKKWYFIDTTGARAFGGDWNYASPFSEGVAVVSSGESGPYKFIDATGAVIAELKWTPDMGIELTEFNDGQLRVKDGDRYGFVDQEGYLNVLSDYLDAHVAFSQQRVGVAQPDKMDYSDNPPLVWGFVDTYGEEQSAFAFEAAEPYQEGMAAVLESGTGLWGFLRLDGSWAIEPTFSEKPAGFVWGLCKVGSRYINQKGVGIWRP